MANADPPARWPNFLASSAKADKKRAALLAAIGLVPTVGGPARATVDLLWGSAFNRRVSSFIDMLCVKVVDLELAVEDIQSRLQSDATAAVGVLAAQAASRSADDEKVERLAAAVANVVADQEIWEAQVDHAQTLTRLIDETTSTQLRLLEYFANPIEWRRKRGYEPLVRPGVAYSKLYLSEFVATAFPELAKQRDALEGAVKGIERLGLLTVDVGSSIGDATFSSIMEAQKGFVSRTGHELLRFTQDRAS